MTKILYIITQSEWGGAQRYVFDLATNLSKSQDYQVYVASGGNGALFTHLEAKNLAVARLKHLGRAINPIQDLLAYFEIKKLNRTIKPDIVHLNSSKAGLLGALAARRAGVPKIIYTAHGFVFNEPLPFWKKWLYKKIELASSKRIDKIICVSDFDKQTGIAAGISPDKLVMIHNGIDTSSLNFLTKEEARMSLRGVRPRRTTKQSYNRDQDSPSDEFPQLIDKIASPRKCGVRNDKVIGCVANFYPTKGLDILIQTMAKIDATLIIIGDGHLRRDLENLINKLGLNKKIFLTGKLDNASQYLKAFDLFVLPSRKEGLPYTLLEATTASTPIVATKVGGVPEIIQDNINGYLAQADNVDALATAINLGLNKPLTPIIIGFDLEAMLQKTKTVYKE